MASSGRSVPGLDACIARAIELAGAGPRHLLVVRRSGAAGDEARHKISEGLGDTDQGEQ